MKSIKTKIFAILLLGGMFSCSDDTLRVYDKTQQLDAVEAVNDPFLLSSIIKKTTIFYEDQAYSTTTLPGATQYIVRNYQGGDNYYSAFKQPSDKMYDAMDILKLVDASIKLSAERLSYTHQGIFQIFRVMLFQYMTDFYGDVYYSQALQGREGILYPKYDTQQSIYTGLLSEIDNAIGLINKGSETISSTYDLMYAGDKTKWLKLANSVKLRLLVHASAKLTTAGTEIAKIKDNVLSSASDNAAIQFIGTAQDNAWKGGTLNWNSSEEFDKRRSSRTLVNKLISLNDPRLPIWFAPCEKPWTTDPAKAGKTVTTTDPNGYSYTSTWEYIDLTNAKIAAQKDNILDKDQLYTGFIAGMPGDWKNGNGHYDTDNGGVVGNFKVSKLSTLFRQNSHKLLQATIMNADEVQFDLAEAVVKGLITGDADVYYRAGITASLSRWGVSSTNIATYLAQSSISLPTDKAGKLAKIAEQKWIAFFMVGAEPYLDLRRTNLPSILTEGYLVNYQFPVRFRYPANELGQNKDAYDAGVATLSPAVDDQYSKMWLLQ
jgi:hypothetical protein